MRQVDKLSEMTKHLKNPFFQLTVGEKAKARCPDQGTCVQCGYISSQEVKNKIRPICKKCIELHLQVCKACVLLAGLNKGLPQLGVGKSSKHRSLQFDHMLQTNGLADADAQIEQENSG